MKSFSFFILASLTQALPLPALTAPFLSNKVVWQNGTLDSSDIEAIKTLALTGIPSEAMETLLKLDFGYEFRVKVKTKPGVGGAIYLGEMAMKLSLKDGVQRQTGNKIVVLESRNDKGALSSTVVTIEPPAFGIVVARYNANEDDANVIKRLVLSNRYESHLKEALIEVFGTGAWAQVTEGGSGVYKDAIPESHSTRSRSKIVIIEFRVRDGDLFSAVVVLPSFPTARESATKDVKLISRDAPKKRRKSRAKKIVN